ncbi:dTMP kinase [Phycisphaera mikurensis]|uniref:Thymidylate kinase n=1 Tax=Phycisphaera mikurensis (strain NBRC 102666 / KCTC 22515 / FYK2301M01) TaxID=1142394 RepID=I0ID53_PHYMF|nr:dTMP kinase [Phycisphaera mikurensis]MBB6442315.1 dTMP kinase [Phycisphaera mikurensis]BAM03191.1 thymidylate kinase [Phycisphaera mikurensis NBRC 102666]
MPQAATSTTRSPPAAPGWSRPLAGRFLVFDGPDGAGKSTQLRRFQSAAEKDGLFVTTVREPGGTEVGERVRNLVLNYPDERCGAMDTRAEMLLFMASRAQLVAQRIRPALAAGHLVLADRFLSSTLAYQGTAGGLPLAEIRGVGEVALGGCRPDLVVIFDVDPVTASSRLNPLLDRVESRDAGYQERVRAGFLAQAEADPAGHLLIDATASESGVAATLRAGLAERFPAG